MKKSKLFSALLLLGIGYIGNMDVIAQTKSLDITGSNSLFSAGNVEVDILAQTKSTTPKKRNNKAISKTTHHHRITERDLTECTKLVDRVAQRGKSPVVAMMPAQNKLLDITNKPLPTAHIKSPVEAQLFAADHADSPAQTNKTVTVKPTTPLATLATQPSFKPTTATLVTTAPVRHTIPNQAKAQAQPVVNNPFSNTKVVAPIKDLHSSIEISSAPKKADLDHLHGKSANLAEITKANTITVPKNKKTKTTKKTVVTTSEKKKH